MSKTVKQLNKTALLALADLQNLKRLELTIILDKSILVKYQWGRAVPVHDEKLDIIRQSEELKKLKDLTSFELKMEFEQPYKMTMADSLLRSKWHDLANDLKKVVMRNGHEEV